MILHGLDNERPPDHWQFQLAAELARRGYEVRYPGLPDPFNPSLERWLAVLACELAAPAGPRRTVGGRTVGGRAVDGRTVGGRAVDGRTVGGRAVDGRTVVRRTVICHSLSCLLWLHAATRGQLDVEAVDRVLLVAPPDSTCLPPEGASFAIGRLDVDAVRRSARSELALVCSDGDPYSPRGAQALYGDQLGIVTTVIPGAGHITPDEGYGRWPWVERWSLDDGAGNVDDLNDGTHSEHA